MDDVLNISGHRISTAEIEAALVEHRAVAESAVVGSEDELTGQAINVFVALSQQETIQNSCAEQELIKKELVGQIRSKIGPFAAPKNIFILLDLPKTRSGKIMRRILRKILAGEEDQLGDITTLADPSVVVMVIDVVRKSKRE
jgi:acetyl-CoA synthetase